MALSEFEVKQLVQSLHDIVRDNRRGMTRDDLFAAMGVRKNDRNVSEAIDFALNTARLVKKDQFFCTPRMVGKMRGSLSRSPRGFGFCGDGQGDDIFIPPNALAGAMHGDEVLCTILPPKFNGKGPEGRVERVITRNTKYVVGTVDLVGRAPRLIPDEPKLCDAIFIDSRFLGKAKHGQRVVLQMRTYAEGNMPAYGMVCEVLGDPRDKGNDITAILRSHGLFEKFPDEVKRETAPLDGATVSAEERKGREDFRDLFTVTIDGRDSKDFDDAVSIEYVAEDVTRLYVHIADVSHYVQEGTALNAEAFKRGTSVYLPDRVCPMLPEELSNGICSLNAGVDRLTLTAILDVNDKGRVIGSEICQGVIRVDRRLVYEDVTAYLEGKSHPYSDDDVLCQNLTVMGELASRLHRVRQKRGCVDFDLSESAIVLDEQGHTVDVYAKQVGVANGMIEEFMLLANEAVAQFLDDLELPGIFRVHETPDPQKIKDFAQYIALFGFKFPPIRKEVTPKHLQQVAIDVEHSDAAFAINRIMLRSMQKARYAAEDLGHFSLALKNYCHFTSPIRRYPDLMVHRVLTLHLTGQINEENYDRLSRQMPEVAEHCSNRERNAMEAERDAVDLKKCEYVRDHLGDICDAVISGVTSYGFYAEMDNTVEGLVRIGALDGEYIYDEKRVLLMNNRNRKTFRIGDRVRVILAAADLVNRTIDLGLVEDEEDED